MIIVIIGRGPDPESLEPSKVGGVVRALAFHQCGPDSIPCPEIKSYVG